MKKVSTPLVALLLLCIILAPQVDCKKKGGPAGGMGGMGGSGRNFIIPNLYSFW